MITLPWRKTPKYEPRIDLPMQLRGSIASEDLAQAIHRATLFTYGLGAIEWDNLHDQERQHFRRLAQALVVELKPKGTLIGYRFNRFAKRLETASNGR